jgi:hypothetical protein
MTRSGRHHYFKTSPILGAAVLLVLCTASPTLDYTWAATGHMTTCWPMLSMHNQTLNSAVARFGNHKPTTDIQRIANLLLDTAPSPNTSNPVTRGSKFTQVVTPAYIYTNPNQPQQFGDGQMNAMTSWGDLQEPPFTATLERATDHPQRGVLSIMISRLIAPPSTPVAIEYSTAAGELKNAITAAGSLKFTLEVNLAELGWNSLFNAKTFFFRLKGWSHWFALSFPQPYMKASEFLTHLPPHLRTLSENNASVINPLNQKAGTADPHHELSNLDHNQAAGFVLGTTPESQRVHGVFQTHNGQSILTGRGGVTVRYRLHPFKMVVMAKTPRSLKEEVSEGTVSGTGPHFVGAPAEIIANTISKESLMTFYGYSLSNATPDGQPLAYNFSQMWMGTWLEPDYVFITPKGNYHWHLNHIEGGSVAAVVLTPPKTPTENNGLGFK